MFIDGDHSSVMARNGFERFGRRVVREIAGGGDYRLVKVVKRLAHLERLR